MSYSLACRLRSQFANLFCHFENMRKISWIAALLFVGLHETSLLQEAEKPERRPASSKEILAATGDFERAVNGSAIVRNRCRVQGKESEIEETAEIFKRDGCKLVVRARKITRDLGDQAVGHPAEAEKGAPTDSPSDRRKPVAQQEIEFTVYADLSELTTPVLLETQKFNQCEVAGERVLKVSSRAEPGKTIQVIRKLQADGSARDDPGAKQARRDLSLFFASPVAAERARKMLERAVQSCGGKEWPDEDDLP